MVKIFLWSWAYPCEVRSLKACGIHRISVLADLLCTSSHDEISFSFLVKSWFSFFLLIKYPHACNAFKNIIFVMFPKSSGKWIYELLSFSYQIFAIKLSPVVRAVKESDQSCMDILGIIII